MHWLVLTGECNDTITYYIFQEQLQLELYEAIVLLKTEAQDSPGLLVVTL